MTKSRNIGRGGARPRAGRPKKVREGETLPPRKAFSTAAIPDLTDVEIRRVLSTILLNPAMPPTARVRAGRALLGRDGADWAADAELDRLTFQILGRVK